MDVNLFDAQQTITMLKYREYAYKTEADPLYHQSKRGDATEQQWLDKVAEIKQRYPYPEGCTPQEAEQFIEDYLAAEAAALKG